MKLLDFFLTLLIPSLILLHLLVAPYTKVEESFNLQATHDILVYSTPTHDIGARLRATYDHFEFPGAVPRTFVGAAALAGVSQPVLQVLGWRHGQFVVRAILGLFNAAALLRYKHGADKAFGKSTGRWYILLQASQFHVIYYASRTLPNMFAFGLSTLALRELLPMPISLSKGLNDSAVKRHSLSIYLLVLAGVIFRAELALLLMTQLLYLLQQSLFSLQTIIPIGLRSAVVALAISIPVDSYFWQRPIWPELASFYYNVIHGKSAEWGTSPFHAYFTSLLPRLLLNPAIILLIPSAFYFPSTRLPAIGLVMPSLAFIIIYALQPHKEARFIIYIIPPLTACAALSANYIFTRRSKSLINRFLLLLVIISTIGSFAGSIIMLGISSLNYPGGEALFRLHDIVMSSGQSNGTVSVHMDVLACMTGVSRFQQDFPTPPLLYRLTSIFLSSDRIASDLPKLASSPLSFHYDKTEDPSSLLDPNFWTQFDYVLAELPGTVIGRWEIVDTIYGYAGIEILRPGVISSSSVVDNSGEVGEAWEEMRRDIDASRNVARDEKAKDSKDMSIREIFYDEVEKLGLYGAVRESTRRWITKGWWVGPRMEAKIRILRRVP